MAQDEMSVFEKLHDAAQMNRGVHLTFAEVELLMDVLGDSFGKVEQEYEKWKAIFEEYQRNYTIEQAQSSDATNE
jgi:hypothetical protein